MLVSGFPGTGYLSAASPMLVALCTCHACGKLKYKSDILRETRRECRKAGHYLAIILTKPLGVTLYRDIRDIVILTSIQ